MDSKYFWVGIVAMLLIALGVFLFLNIYTKKGSELLPISSDLLHKKDVALESASSPDQETTPLSKVKSKEDFTGPIVLYSGGKFFPKKIILTGKPEGSGCLLMIFNDSQNQLVIRLSPHSLKDDRGFPYLPIPPGTPGIIDPRYHMADVAFHNHKNPSEEFLVHLEEPCI